jgi:hypothetical protein
MKEEHTVLWKEIKAFELDAPESSLSFSSRLARENGWTLEFSLRAIEEYKKFIFLICIADHPLTPSDQVDQGMAPASALYTLLLERTVSHYTKA